MALTVVKPGTKILLGEPRVEVVEQDARGDQVTFKVSVAYGGLIFDRHTAVTADGTVFDPTEMRQ